MYYRDNPTAIRTRTVASRKPPPTTTHLLKGDPDSATSPSKYRPSLSNVVSEGVGGSTARLPLSDGTPGFGSSTDEDQRRTTNKRKRFRKRKTKKSPKKADSGQDVKKESVGIVVEDKDGPKLVENNHVTRVLASDWSRAIT